MASAKKQVIRISRTLIYALHSSRAALKSCHDPSTAQRQPAPRSGRDDNAGKGLGEDFSRRLFSCAVWDVNGNYRASMSVKLVAILGHARGAREKVRAIDQNSVLMGCVCQMFALYSLMARSEENLPMRAVLRIDFLVHASSSR